MDRGLRIVCAPVERARFLADPAQDDVLARAGALRAHSRLAVLGAAGTGKTTTAVRAALAARDAGVPADRILLLAFSRRGVADARDALARFAYEGPVPLVATFHALAFGIVGEAATSDGDAPPRLLSGAEEDVRVRELLLGGVEEGTLAWPEDLAAALPTLGLANDVRAVLARLRELGLLPQHLAAAGAAAGQPAWEAIARFAAIESEVMSLENVIDYASLLESACELVETGSFVSPWDAFYVDDFHEADPLQARLIAALARGRALVAFGNPDAAVYGFRGADRQSLIDLAAGGDAIVLDRVHRGGPRLRAGVERVLGTSVVPGLPAPMQRSLRCPAPGVVDDDLAVRSYDSMSDLLAHVAFDLRGRHVDGGVPWEDMAIVVRSSGSVDGVRRALEQAGVPARVGADEVPLRSEPAVGVLLTALDVAVRPDALTPDVAADLLTGPLGGIDPADLRILGRELRARWRRERPDAPMPSSAQAISRMLAEAIAEPGVVGEPGVLVEPALMAAPLGALGRLLGEVRRAAHAGELPADLIWRLWSHQPIQGMAWPDRLRSAALAGHRASGHDLDAVSALLDAADRMSERYSGVVGVPNFLASLAHQRVPAEAVADRGSVRGVAIVTAHLSLGREWDHIVVVGAQEGIWPPLRGRTSVLHVDELEAVLTGDVLDPVQRARRALGETLAEERRLFALAISRARRSAVVAVVAAPDDQGDQPSRFVEDLDIAAVHEQGRPPRDRTMDGLVAELRAVAQGFAGGGSEDADLGQAAVVRLARLAVIAESGHPLVPAADPRTWWGSDDLTPGAGPIRPATHPVALSASALEALGDCPLKWFLGREAGADTARGHALAFGSIVHALAEGLVTGELPPDPDVLLARADLVWDEIGFEAPWHSVAQRADLRAALTRLCTYHVSGREVLATEHRFDVVIPLARDAEQPIGAENVRIRGSIDRVEVTSDGRVMLIDLKTGGTAPSRPRVAEHEQLALYQAAVRVGAVAEVLAEAGHQDADLAGAALVHLRLDAGRSEAGPKVQEQAPLDDADLVDSWIVDRLRDAVDLVRREEFPATPGQVCRTCPYVRVCPADRRGEAVLA